MFAESEKRDLLPIKRDIMTMVLNGFRRRSCHFTAGRTQLCKLSDRSEEEGFEDVFDAWNLLVAFFSNKTCTGMDMPTLNGGVSRRARGSVTEASVVDLHAGNFARKGKLLVDSDSCGWRSGAQRKFLRCVNQTAQKLIRSGNQCLLHP